MKIIIVANFVTFPLEGGNSRFTYLLDKMDCKKNECELITSNFKHGAKEKRFFTNEQLETFDYKVTLIDEPGYKKNVSIKRIISHKILAKNIYKYLKSKTDLPDVIYCSIPAIDIAYFTLKYAKENNIRFILDIQDLWPESFKMAFNIPIISDILFYPMMKKANYVYSHSDEIVAVSETFVNRATRSNNRESNGLSVFLGTDLEYFDKCAIENKVEFKDKLIRIVYIGSLGTSYDIRSVIDAIKEIKDNGVCDLKFIVMGDGPLKEDFEKYAQTMHIDCEFTGKLPYSKMVGLLCSCDIAVNPINGASVASIINKVGDYAAAGLPVINTQNSNEYRELLDIYKAGFNCENGNSIDISKKLEKLIKNKNLRLRMGKANRKLAEDKFDRDKTYKKIIDLIIDNN